MTDYVGRIPGTPTDNQQTDVTDNVFTSYTNRMTREMDAVSNCSRDTSETTMVMEDGERTLKTEGTEILTKEPEEVPMESPLLQHQNIPSDEHSRTSCSASADVRQSSVSTLIGQSHDVASSHGADTSLTADWSWEDGGGVGIESGEGWRRQLSRSTDECRRLAAELDDMHRQKRNHDDLVQQLTAQLATSLQQAVGKNNNGEASALTKDGDEDVTADDDVTTLRSEIRRLRSEVNSLVASCENLESDRSNLAEELRRRSDSVATGLDSANQTDDNKELDTMPARLQWLEAAVVRLTDERDGLENGLEELDGQHQLAIEQVLASREELQFRCQTLTTEREEVESALRKQVSELIGSQQIVEKQLQKSMVSNSSLQTELSRRDATSVQLIQAMDDLWQSFAGEVATDEWKDSKASSTDILEMCRMVKVAVHKIFFKVEELEESYEQSRSEVKRLQENVVPEMRREYDEIVAQLRAARDRERHTIKEDVLGEELESLRARIQTLEAELVLGRAQPVPSQRELVTKPEVLERECQTVGVSVNRKNFGSQTIQVLERNFRESESQVDLEVFAVDDQESLAVLREHVRELQAMNTNLEETLRERDSRVASLNGILNVYKENLDPDRESARSAALEVERRHEAQLSGLRSERDQMMAVLDAKARENSNLKAEVHRLMNVVSAERAALNKMQHDLGAEQRPTTVTRDENPAQANMLARQVRDSELELEALRQRNQTLVTLLQETDARTKLTSDSDGNASATVQGLMTEREDLRRQVDQHRGEKEQIVTALNQKHRESLAYHAEIQRLLEVVRTQTTRAELLEQEHAAMARQFEDKQQALLEMQNEELSLRRRVSDVERARDSIHAKYNRLLQEEDHTRKETDSVEKECAEEDKELLGVHVDREEWTAKLKELEQLQRQAQDRDRLLYEKDCQMHEKMRTIDSTRELLARREEEAAATRLHLEHAGRELTASREDTEAARQQNGILRQRADDLRSEIAVLKESNSSLNVTLQEREFELKALREKLRTLSLWIEQHASSSSLGAGRQLESSSSSAGVDGGEDGERTLKRLMSESEEMRQRAQGFQAERDQALLALAHRQREIEALHEQIRGPREREERLLKELERLRQHLVHVEESYTQEALRAEDREKELRVRLALAEDRLRLATSSRSAESQHASLQVESLQEQLRVIMEQRDSAQQKLSAIEDQLAKREAAFRTLQVVLEQLQQERKRDLTTIQIQHNSKLMEEQRHSQKLAQEIKALEVRIQESAEALEAASRLSAQLDRKEEVVRALREEVDYRDAALQKAKIEIDRITNNSEVTVDRSIMKNLVVGFLTVPQGQQKKEVLRVIATILDFNKIEREKTGLDEIRVGWIGWFSGRSPGNIGRKKSDEAAQQSFSEAFVRFLENESKPRQQIQLPLDSLMSNKGPTNRQSNQAAVASSSTDRGNGSTNPAFGNNPFAFSMMSPPDSPTSNILLGSSHLLMKPMTNALPTFTPMPVTDNGFSANSVLRDVLRSE